MCPQVAKLIWAGHVYSEQIKLIATKYNLGHFINNHIAETTTAWLFISAALVISFSYIFTCLLLAKYFCPPRIYSLPFKFSY